MATTVQNIGDAALRIIGQMGAPGRGSSTEEQAEYLAELNNIIDQFNAERLMIYEITRNVYSFVSGTAAYTMGTGGSFATTRPARIEALGFVTADPQEEPIKILSYQEWRDQVPLKASAGSIVKVAWIDYAYPALTINFWPVPNSSAFSASVYAWNAVVGPFANISTAVALPPAYEQLLEYTLAVNLAPRFKVPIRQDWIALATAAKQTVARMNQQTLPPDQISVEIPAGDPPPDPSVARQDAA